MAEKKNNAESWCVALYPGKTKRSFKNNGNLQLDRALQLKSEDIQAYVMWFMLLGAKLMLLILL